MKKHKIYFIETNAYGPIHSALALLYSVHFNLPRLFFVLLWLSGAFGLSLAIDQNSCLPDTHKYGLYLALLLNPLFWVFVVKYSTNNIVMAFFGLASIVLLSKKKDVLSGVCMAIAIALKFIPAVMLPFLIFSKTRIRWRFAFSVGIALIFIFGASYLLWGNEILYPFQMGYERSSKILSIFRFLRGQLSPLRLFTNDPNLDGASVYLCLIALSAFFYVHIQHDLEGILSSIIAMGILLTLYKVGHPQFYITFT